MISAIASVPVMVLICYDLDVVDHNPLQPITIEVSFAGNGHIHILNHIGYAKGQEKYVRLLRMTSPERAFIAFYLRYELPFYGVDVV